MGEASLWILIFHEWQPIFNSIWIFKPLEEYIKRIGFCGVDIFYFYLEWECHLQYRKE